MASGMNNYAGGSMNEYAGMHGASIRAGPSRSTTRFSGAVRNPEHADLWDQISDEHRSEINDCVSGYHLHGACIIILPRARGVHRTNRPRTV
ncbi:hypothetical protein RRF57_001856 [Xylaria bambusicola]|uniref:Uncharacterized protein n=1 Tax=Xylaria bambusicola TaxID=326684 RepID=A0AAN7UJC9_9PEZI